MSYWKYPTTSMIRCELPARSACTVTLPSGLPVSERTALLARTWPARKLIVEVGLAMPVGPARRSPSEVGVTTVRLTATDRAAAGTPQRPASGKRRLAPLPATAGPPKVPAEFRVSTARQGVRVK